MTGTITIPLTKGYSTVVDSIDADLAEFEWQVHIQERGIYAYGRMRGCKSGIQKLHRIILGRKIGRELHRTELCDHVRGNGLLNVRSNLRLATKTQNTVNHLPRKNCRSGVTGVTWDKGKHVWGAFITINGRHTRLGRFADFDEAVAVRHAAEIEHYGEFSPLLSRQEQS